VVWPGAAESTGPVVWPLLALLLYATFTLGTRNSFIVLPFALSLPPGWEVVAIVVVTQSLVESFGMVFYVWFVPRRLFPDVAPP